MYVSGVESKLPNGVMLPVEYAEYGAQVHTPEYSVRNIHGCSAAYSVLSNFAEPLFFYSIVLCCHPSSLLLFLSASVLLSGV